MSKINVKIIADSLHPNDKDRITTMQITFPRYILAELNTHRVFSRNSASSRAIPFNKMIQSVVSNPFIPIAFQKDHKGMQGNEYLDMDKEYTWDEISKILNKNLKKAFYDEKTEEWDSDYIPVDYVLNYSILPFLTKNEKQSLTIKEWWLKARDCAVSCAIMLHTIGVTKQICNRLLEPFMWHTVLITSTEWENFFELRCPQYKFQDGIYRSKKDVMSATHKPFKFEIEEGKFLEYDQVFNDISFWQIINKGQADIHMMVLAESIWDAVNESIPKKLKEGEWHIPFNDNINNGEMAQAISPNEALIYKNLTLEDLKIKIATARCARISYTTVGKKSKEYDYQKDIELHDNLAKNGHWSPFEHCARAMREDEYELYAKGKLQWTTGQYINVLPKTEDQGWCRNFKGFIQYRSLIDN